MWEAQKKYNKERYESDEAYREHMKAKSIECRRERMQTDVEYKKRVVKQQKERQKERMSDPDFAAAQKAKWRQAYLRRKKECSST